jgi:tRNA (guanine-N7-)-methyltransferase
MWITLSEYLKKINSDSRKYFEFNDRILEVKDEDIPLNFAKIFGNSDPVKFEIGFGNGESLIKLAKRHPGINYFGIDRKMDRVRITLKKLNKSEKLPNLMIARMGTDYIDQIVPDGSCEEVIMNFPDPWPKKKHHKNRTINADFLIIIHNMLKPGGCFRFASDHQEYSEEVYSVLEESELFENCYMQPYKDESRDRIETQFEMHKKREGFNIHYIKFRKIS